MIKNNSTVYLFNPWTNLLTSNHFSIYRVFYEWTSTPIYQKIKNIHPHFSSSHFTLPSPVFPYSQHAIINNQRSKRYISDINDDTREKKRLRIILAWKGETCVFIHIVKINGRNSPKCGHSSAHLQRFRNYDEADNNRAIGLNEI